MRRPVEQPAQFDTREGELRLTLAHEGDLATERAVIRAEAHTEIEKLNALAEAQLRAFAYFGHKVVRHGR